MTKYVALFFYTFLLKDNHNVEPTFRYGGSMKKRMSEQNDNRLWIVNDYGRARLITYAESFRDLAKTFAQLQEKKNQQLLLFRETEKEDNRQEYIMRRMLFENRGILTDHLNEMADIMYQVAEETAWLHKAPDEQFKALRQIFREYRIKMQDLCIMENKDKVLEMSISLSCDRKRKVTAKDIEKMLSGVLGRKIQAFDSSPLYLMNCPQKFGFTEKPKFSVMTGIARAVKENETASGDSYAFAENDKGKIWWSRLLRAIFLLGFFMI